MVQVSIFFLGRYNASAKETLPMEVLDKFSEIEHINGNKNNLTNNLTRELVNNTSEDTN